MLTKPEFQYYPDFIKADEAELLFETLKSNVNWEQRSIKMFGKTIPQPRLTAWYGDAGISYTYSGLLWEALPWTPELLQIKAKLEMLTGESFNSVLLNYYRDGNDSMGWHSDDEKELGHNPVIASVSLGAVRKFQVKPKKGEGNLKSYFLENGSLLVMLGDFQELWKHALPKDKKVLQGRINLTFRKILF